MYYFLFLFFAATVAARDCPYKPADIIFVIDGSGSEGRHNFQKQLAFIQNFTDQFSIGTNNTLVSVIAFGTTPHNAFWLNTHTAKDALSNAIANVHYPNGETYTDLALDFVHRQTLSAQHGARPQVPKYVIVMTDGRSNNQTATSLAAIDLKKLPKMSVMAIGIGGQVDQTELDNIATDHKHVFSVNSFDALQSIQTDLTTTTCSVCGDAPADIIFMLDSSGSEGPENFAKQLRFVNLLVNEFDIGPTDTRIGLVTFSTAAMTDIQLNQYTAKDALLQAVQRVQFRDGETNTHLGLRIVHSQSFRQSHGGRDNAKKFLVVLTDGRSTEGTETIRQAKVIHNDSVEVFAIGIGPHVDRHEIIAIATNKHHIYNVKNFNQLDAVHQAVFNRICENRVVAPTTMPTTTTKPECGAKQADIVFVLDSSDSEGQDNFRIQTDFVEAFARQFKIGRDNLQFGLVTFSSDVNNVFWLNTYHSRHRLLDAIRNTPYVGAGTNTSAALQFVREESFTAAHGARPNATSIVVVITDGRSADPAATTQQAQLLHPIADVYSIGVGPAVDHDELRSIASGRHKTFNVNSFQLLHTIQTQLTDTACANP